MDDVGSLQVKEREVIHHIFHEHPLRRIQKPDNDRWEIWCYGCYRYFISGEAAYGCCTDDCDFRDCFHEECAEMPREIRHHLHPQHTLTLHHLHPQHTLTLQKWVELRVGRCAVCDESTDIFSLVYICSVDKECVFWIHLRCAGEGDLQLHNELEHPSHPHHALNYVRRPSLFMCNACGATDHQHKGASSGSYICTICDYWIHESCADLPATAAFNHLHHHELSLAFHLPLDYIRYEYECAVCRGALRLRRWVYHCYHCSYVVHIKCATNNTSNEDDSEKAVDVDEKDIIKFPIDDCIYEELIKPFVERSSDHKYKLLDHHHHPLSFIEFSVPEEEEEDDDDEEEEAEDDIGNIIQKSALITICEGCTLPIMNKKISSTIATDKGYMSCGECNYSLHLACFNLPPQLPSHPLHSIKDHKLALRKSGKLINWPYCSVCYHRTNGLIYACTATDCYFKIDIKCASLPDTIKHEGHPQHNHYLKLLDKSASSFCRACYRTLLAKDASYKCNSCYFVMCCLCVFLPRTNKHRLEKHELPLTYNARVNRPGEFYCASCEVKILNPRMWMYHCRDCDQSFHAKCIPATSGEYRNINFGREKYYVNVTTAYHQPHHPLRFQPITKKKRCDLCHQDAYDDAGFQCETCNFVMCFKCGKQRMDPDVFNTINQRQQKLTFE